MKGPDLQESIPKVIHYFWFGGGPKPDVVHDCLHSWRVMMPEWEIVEWNESNYDVTQSTYPMEAYETRMWAFVSDYARFDILESLGGLYFDTDVELLKPIPEEILGAVAFTGMDPSGRVSPGLVFGAIPRHPIVQEILDSYNRSHFIVDGCMDTTTVNTRVTEIMIRHGFRPDDTLQEVAGVRVYPSDYFCGYDMDVREPRVVANTIAMHHYAGSWGNAQDSRRRSVQGVVKRVLGVTVYRRLLSIKRRLFGVRGA